jgi:glycosyltransferase involved in cell wall biosynthesis
VCVPPGDAGALASALGDLLRMPAAVRAAMGDRGRARVVATYGLTNCAERYASLYTKLAQRRE